VEGGTFTITNLGTYGVDAFTPIINHGEAAILGRGASSSVPRCTVAESPGLNDDSQADLRRSHRRRRPRPAAAFLQTVIEMFNYGER